MPFGAILGGVASGLVGGLFGGGSSGGGYSGGSYLPPNLNQAATNEMGLLPQLGGNNLYAQNLGQAQGIAQGAVNSPYYGQALQGSQNAAAMGQAQGYNAGGAANQLYGQMQQIPGLQGALVQSAFDPQNQLYNYEQALNANQTNASLAARGLNTSGVGGQIAAQQNQLFNQNWQNNLLSRQLAGVRGVGVLNQSAAGLGGAAASLGTQGTNMLNQSAAMPYSTQLGAAQSGLGLLGTVGGMGAQAALPIQQQIADYNAYQGRGSPSAQFGQQQAMAAGAGALGMGIGNYLGNNMGNSGSTATAGAPYSNALAGLGYSPSGYSGGAFGGISAASSNPFSSLGGY